MLLTVNYHYIRSLEDSQFPGIHGVTPERLKEQLAYLARNFCVIEPADLERISSSDPNNMFCLVTFDDGLKEQYLEALPILEQMGIKGLFCVNGINSAENRVSSVHKIHWIRSRYEPKKFTEMLLNELKRMDIQLPIDISEFSSPEGQNNYDDLEVKFQKYLLFHAFNEVTSNSVIDNIYRGEKREEIEHSSDLYMSKNMLIDLGKKGALGSHGWTHDNKNRTELTRLREDFQRNQSYISSLTGSKVDFISYPYGGKDAVSLEVANVARQAGHLYGFTIERAFALEFVHPLLLPRLDTNDVPKGKAPLFAFIDKRPKIIGNMKHKSDWFQHGDCP